MHTVLFQNECCWIFFTDLPSLHIALTVIYHRHLSSPKICANYTSTFYNTNLKEQYITFWRDYWDKLNTLVINMFSIVWNHLKPRIVLFSISFSLLGSIKCFWWWITGFLVVILLWEGHRRFSYILGKGGMRWGVAISTIWPLDVSRFYTLVL